MADDQCALAVAENLAQRADLADRVEFARLDDGQCLVEAQGLPLAQRVEVDVGRARQTHLAARREDVDGLIGVDLEEHAVPTRWLPETVDLFAEGNELLSRFLEGFQELGVACRQIVDALLEVRRIRWTPEGRAAGFRVQRGRVSRSELVPGRIEIMACGLVCHILTGGFMAIRFGHC